MSAVKQRSEVELRAHAYIAARNDSDLDALVEGTALPAIAAR